MADEKKVEILIDAKPKKSKKPVASDKKSTLKKTRKENAWPTTGRRVVLLLVKIAFFAVLVFVVFFVVFGVTRMKDNNMHPAVKDGDLLVYYRMENSFGNGDVVVVDKNGVERIMRIIASPGQELDISGDGVLTVDGQPSTFQAFYETERAESYGFKYPYRVSEGCYFMLNDYRADVNDSRMFGEVCRDKIKGRLITKIQVRDL